MSLLLEVALKTAALFLIALLVLLALRNRSAAVRHSILAATFVCAIAVPTLTLLAPAWRLPIPASWLALDGGTPVTFSSAQPPAPSTAVTTDAQPAPGSRPRPTTLQIAAGVWLAGTLVGIGIIIVGMWRVRRLAGSASSLDRGVWRECADRIASTYGLRRRVEILHSSHPSLLVTWGILRPRVLLPAAACDWSEDRVHIVLCHELAHVKRGDWPVLIAAGLLRSAHWFNPLIWIAHRRLRQESEQASDDLVLSCGVTGTDYASHLLAVAREAVLRRHTWSTAIAIAHPSTLEGRVRAMLNDRVNRTPLTARGRWTAAIASLAATLAIAGAGISALAAPADMAPAPPQSALAPTRSIELENATIVIGDSRLTAARMRLEVPATDATQAKPGTIAGVLYDQLGGLLPGASVKLVQRPGGGAYDTLTDRNGAFSFSVLPPGDYELTTSLAGFATVTNLVKVGTGGSVERSITLPIGTVEETISVVGESGPYSASGARPASRPRPAPTERTFFSGGIGGQIKAPAKTLHVSPVYPRDVPPTTDVVRLTGRVGIDGFISDLREVEPLVNVTGGAHAAFVASALDATKQWEFTPVLLNNVPVEANITITVHYSAR